VAERATAFAPGRVNLIGEHTDYNEGLALPFAIGDGVTVRATRTRGDRVHVIAADLGAQDDFSLSAPGPAKGWRAFVRGAVAELTAAGCDLAAAHLEIAGSVPRGSGLSSSAALEVALCLALLAVSGADEPGRLALAQICSRVENDWVGARTGLLDQLASLCGETDCALSVDFQSLDVTPVPLELDGYSLITLDSGQRHSNADDGSAAPAGYNRRRAECARACELLEIDSLRQATLEMARGLPEPLASRARHVLTENERVRATVAALSHGNMERVGELLNESHASLRDCYEVSTPAVKRTVARLRDAGAVGARIMGGGFGGHILGLIPHAARAPEDAIVVTPSAGARIL